MIKIVIDTNVLVSALLSPEGNPAKVLALAMNDQYTVCYDSRIMLEYENVLRRSKFPFDPQDVMGLINTLIQRGTAVVAAPHDEIFTDSADKKFYEVAKTVGAYLITGNGRHFPADPCIISPADFLDQIYK